MATKLVLIRHGTTDCNRQKRYCGYKDVSLSREGRAQAAHLSQRLKYLKFDRIYCSDRKRCLQTARIIFDRKRIIKVKDLREINFGVLEGLRHKEIVKKYGGIYEKWLVNPFKNHIPRVEAMNAFKRRVQRSIKKIVCRNPGKTIAVICHGGVIGVYVSGILKSNDFWRYIPGAASMTLVECLKGKPRLKKFNIAAQAH